LSATGPGDHASALVRGNRFAVGLLIEKVTSLPARRNGASIDMPGAANGPLLSYA
jgi:hypothetical protein